MSTIKNFLMYLSIVFVITSCNKNDELIDTDTEKANEEIDYVYGPITKIKDNFSENFSKKNNSISNDWKRIDYWDLKKLTIPGKTASFTNQHDLRNRFAWIMGSGDRWPVSVSVNNDKFESVNSANPNDHGYEWYTDFRVKGQLTKRKTENYTNWRRVPNTNRRSERNKGKKGRWMELPGEWRVMVKNTKSWNVEGSITTEVGGKAGIPFVTEGSVKVAVTLKAGGGGSKESSVTEVIRGGRIWVPAGKVANWELSERHQDINSTWKMPLEFRGRVAADYGKKKYNGHHWWNVSASRFFDEYTRKNNPLTYIVKVKEQKGKEVRIRSWVTNN